MSTLPPPPPSSNELSPPMATGAVTISVHHTSPTSSNPPQPLVDRKGRLWQERTLKIKPTNETGYGFSLSGQRPVFVESVREGGPAQKAGIKSGDRLIKVDGQNVFEKKHPDVVELLKGATEVTLTVITQYSQPSQGKSELSSGPQKIQELTLNALRAMLEKQHGVYEQMILEYSRGASDRLEGEIRECEEIIKTLQSEIAVKASTTIEAVAQGTEASISTLLGSDRALERRGRLARDDTMIAHKILCTMSDGSNDMGSSSNNTLSQPQSLPPHSSSALINSQSIASPTKFRSPKMFRKASLSKMFHQSTTDSAPHSRTSSPTKALRSQSMLNDSDLSDEDLEFGTPTYGPFSSLQELNNYPAHMSVFLHYLFQNKDPKYLCFYLVAQSYQNHYKGNDFKQKGFEITWTFCLLTSPLYVSLEEGTVQKILDTLESEESEMKLKSVFVEARDVVANQIAEDLSAYRQKRMLGLGSMYGEQQLTDHMTSSKECEISNSTLNRILKDILSERSDSVEDANRNHALTDSVCTFLMDTNKGKSPKYDSSLFEKIQSFTRSEVNKRKISKQKKVSKCSHNFQLAIYSRTTSCDYCENVLWGIVYQGYQCSACEMNIHRYGCVEELTDTCTGKRKEKIQKRKFSRKSSSTTNTTQQTNTSTSDLDKSSEALYQCNDEEDKLPPASEEETFRSRRRSVSDPKQTLMAVNLVKEEEIVRENLHVIKKKSVATVSRTQSLKERRTQGDTSQHPHSSQDTSLNTTPSWNSVASSSSMSDESLNATTFASGTLSSSGVSKGSTLDTVIEGNGRQFRAKSPFMDDETWHEFSEANVEEELTPWALTARSDVISRLQKFEIQRQELLRELIHTERTHLKKLQIMKYIYKNPLYQSGLLTLQQAEMIFPSLESLVDMHSSFCTEMRDRQAQYSDNVIRNIADVLLYRFEGKPGEKLCQACAIFASNQIKAEKLIKEYASKNPKFRKFLQDAEANPYCNRRSIRDLLPCVWTRLTRYQLLLEQILKYNKKNFDKMKPEEKEESERLGLAVSCIRNILLYVNKVVKQTGNRQQLQDYQMKMETSHLERTTHPIAEKYKELNLTAESRVLLHEGMLTMKISNRKTVDVRGLLLNDIMVLLSIPEEGSDKLLLKKYYIETIGGAREEYSPVIRVKEMILRHFAGDKGGRSFLVVNNSPLMRIAQMYEFTAESVQEKRKWEDNIAEAMNGTADIMSPELYSPTIEDSFVSHPIPLNPLMSNIPLREQLDKIDDSIQKQLDDKLSMLRALQGIEKQDTVNCLQHDSPTSVVENASEIFNTVGELTSQVSKLLVPNPTKHIVAGVQYQLAELTGQLHSRLSGLLISLGKDGVLQTDRSSDGMVTASPTLDEASDTTVSPSDDPQYIMINVNESTPNTTPLPNGSTHGYLDTAALSSSLTPPSTEKKRHLVLERGDRLDDSEDDDDEEEVPPPLPRKPPPSSDSASSTTPPDILDDTPPLDGILPRAISGFSIGSYETHADSFTRIIEPPEAFSMTKMDCDVTSSLVLPQTGQDSWNSKELNRSLSESKTVREGFRRVRSNPSIASNKIMSVISSKKAGSDSPPRNIMRTTSQDVTLVDEYVVKLKSTEN